MILTDTGEQGDEFLYVLSMQIHAGFDTVTVKCDILDDYHPFECTSHHQMLLIKRL